MRFRGKVWRHIPAGGYPAPLGYSIKARGRWNRAGVYGCLYTSLSKKGAVAEYEKLCRKAAFNKEGLGERELVSLDVDIAHVLDLTDHENGIVDPEAAFLTGDTPEDIERCRQLADYIRQVGFNGFISPSAASEGERNLTIYFDGIASEVDIQPGDDRILLA